MTRRGRGAALPCAAAALWAVLAPLGCYRKALPETIPAPAEATEPSAAPTPAEATEQPAAVENPTPQLIPDAGSEDERAIRDKLADAERLLTLLDGRSLTGEQGDQVGTVRAFVAQAREALLGGELQRASVLSDKAVLLATDVEGATRE